MAKARKQNKKQVKDRGDDEVRPVPDNVDEGADEEITPERRIEQAIDALEAGRGDQVDWERLDFELGLEQGDGRWLSSHPFSFTSDSRDDDGEISWDPESDDLGEVIEDDDRFEALRNGAPPTAEELAAFREYVEQQESDDLFSYNSLVANFYHLTDDRGRDLFVTQIQRGVGTDFSGGVTGFDTRKARGFLSLQEAEAWLTQQGSWLG